ncbi:MAG: hypothetical protein ABIH12_00550 [Pseudomonadota bacterium]
MKSAGAAFLLSVAVFAYAMWRNATCGYDCGILDTGMGGSGPAVVIVTLLSFWGLIGSAVVFCIIALLRWRASRQPN